ncbi:hypothetical protein [Sandaracinobacteroides saxicola]|uniref:Uncharacterized protein n=1 Tax=Sandaracinobacteroides saxicola TaxID=2759707 RepID=A0A7G5IDM9_9SPHN|nr:hypothetical protein [Sandaracinobacteroides saxicola]QMW21471.1 hypothetical protein H3309_08485 [Sandaracinobacteroides saxicola]
MQPTDATAPPFDLLELQSLRAELLLRMAVQNLILVLLLPLLLATFIVQLILPATAPLAALGFTVTAGAGALIWCHQGARQVQLKAYLMLLAARHTPDGGWESWLPDHPIGGRLGSRWFISTKGVLLGSQAAALVAAIIQAGLQPLPMLATVAAIAVTAFFLLLNPKESTAPIPGRPG